MSEKIIYLDNAATTQLCKEAREGLEAYLSRFIGNPSSVHGKGFEAQRTVEKSRKIIADFVNADVNEIYFTPGGTYGNNIALLGAVKALKRRGNKIVTSQTEHSSVLDVMKELEREGFELVYVKPDKKGIVRPEDLEPCLDEKTILVSVMLANNETGAIQDIKTMRKLAKKKSPNALFHTDCVSAFTKVNIDVSDLGVELMTACSHKVHGPCGVGMLYISKRARLVPIIFGGGQEKGISPGTESVALISAFAKAVESARDIKGEYKKISELRDYTAERLLQLDGVSINSPTEAMPYILNCSVANIKSETLINYLSSKNIFVSGGSACAKGKQSYVLKAMGLHPDLINSAIRLSFSRYNTKADIDTLIYALREAIATLAVMTKFRKK